MSDVSQEQPRSSGNVVAIKTLNGHSLTVVQNGGVGAENTPIETNRRAVGASEKFTIVPVSGKGAFALQTSGGYYVTAVNGGGIGGPNDASSPVHTDATWIGTWEQLSVEPQADGTFAFRTSTGYYLTAMSGGGQGDPAIQQPIRTNARTIGEQEMFTFAPVPVKRASPAPAEAAALVGA
jgi:hypothetical protein